MDNNELLIDALSRILRLEKEVERLKEKTDRLDQIIAGMNTSSASSQSVQTKDVPSTRDKTKYFFENKLLSKNRFVLAVVTKFCKTHPGITIQQVKAEFDKSLQGSIGVVEDYEIAKKRSDCDTRFFVKNDELIHVQDGIICVCSQWGILNIPNFLRKAEQLQYQWETISK